MRLEYDMKLVDAGFTNGKGINLMRFDGDGYEAVKLWTTTLSATEFIRKNWMRPVRITIESEDE